MPASLCLPPRLSQGEAKALARDRFTWAERFFAAGLVTAGLAPVVYVCVLAGAVLRGAWGL
jgi:hypothetical protein